MLLIASASANDRCASLFEFRYFENSFENSNAKRLLEMFAWYNNASPSMRPTVERQIHKIYREWEREMSDSERVVFPVRPLYMLPKYYGELFWSHTPETRSSAARAPYMFAAERSGLQVEMGDPGLIFSATQLPVEGFLSGDFVVSMDRKIYIHHNQTLRTDGVYKHSSILMSAPVLFAGEIRVDAQGSIHFLTRNSGHYHPRAKHLTWVREFLSENGFQLPETESPPTDAADLL